MREEVRKSRKVLLMATGLSPQVVTETVYALAVERKPRWVPDEVQVFTTVEGAERARLSLLPGGQNWFGRLCAEYGLPPIVFGEGEIHILRGWDGKNIVDIRTRRDNEAAANGLSAAVRNLTADEETEVHVSIAGGRKTMGFFAGYALSLYGRAQDRLSHVLVDSAWESHPEFFYPTKESRIIYTAPPGSRPLDTAAARVELAEIPFVRLRELSEGAGLGSRREGFGGAVRRVQGQVREFRAQTMRMSGGEFWVGDKQVHMARAELAFGAMLMRRAIAGQSSVACPGEGPDPELGAAYLAEYRKLGEKGSERTERALAGGMGRGFFLQRRARYDAAVRVALGDGAEPYCVRTMGRRPDTRYGIGVAEGRLRMEPEGDSK